MKWLNRWILSSMKKAAAEEVAQSANQPSEKVPYYSGNGITIGTNSGPIVKGNSIDSSDRAIRFNVYTASGGRVVETRRVDRQRDREITGLYVITSDQDFGHEIDKIITMEALK